MTWPTGLAAGARAHCDEKAKAYVQSMAGQERTEIIRGLQQQGYVVYEGLDAAGNVKYIGITSRNPNFRFNEHSNSVGTGKEALRYRVIDGATGLSKTGARVVEQKLINQYGLPKNGGVLINKVNSIAPKYWYQYGIKP